MVFLTRIPFLLPGYGIDPDAWGVAYIARQISWTHQYSVSRFPGYPLQELTYSLFWRGGPLILNGITALMSGFAAGFLALIGMNLATQSSNTRVQLIGTPVLGALLFAITPVVYLNSVNSMDYIWAIAFILGSLYFIISGRITLAGLLLGMAIGTRITSIAMLFPFILVLLHKGAHRRDVARFTLISIAVGGIFFIPVVVAYGIGFFRYTQGEPIAIERVLENATTGVWGRVGFGVILVVLSILIWQLIHSESFSLRLRKTAYWKIWLIGIATYLLIYFSLPHEAAYLIPVVPFSILILEEFSSNKMLLLLCLALLCSSMLVEIYPGSQARAAGFDQSFRRRAARVRFSRFNLYFVPFYGALIKDHISRIDENDRLLNIIDFGNELQEKSAIIVGWHISKFATLGKNQNIEKVIYTDFLDQKSIQNLVDEGYRIYYLPELLGTSIELYNVDFREYGGTVIDTE